MTKKLSPAQQKIIDIIKEHDSAFVGAQTNAATRTIHAPSAESLARMGLIVIKGTAPKRVAWLAENPPEVAPAEPPKAGAVAVTIDTSTLPKTHKDVEDFLDRLENNVHRGICSVRFALAQCWLACHQVTTEGEKRVEIAPPLGPDAVPVKKAPEPCPHPSHANPGLITPCPECGEKRDDDSDTTETPAEPEKPASVPPAGSDDQDDEDALSEPSKPKRVVIRSRIRNLNAKGKGTEEYRLLLDNDTLIWADKHPSAIEVESDWCANGIRAHERHCKTRVEVDVGLIVVSIDKKIGNGGGLSYAAGITVGDPDRPIAWEDSVKHIGIKKVGGKHVHILEINGERKTFSGS